MTRRNAACVPTLFLHFVVPPFFVFVPLLVDLPRWPDLLRWLAWDSSLIPFSLSLVFEFVVLCSITTLPPFIMGWVAFIQKLQSFIQIVPIPLFLFFESQLTPAVFSNARNPTLR